MYFTEVAAIPDPDMRTMDLLWRAASAGRYGYSVQRELWLQNRRQWPRFFKAIDWVQGENNVYRCTGVAWAGAWLRFACCGCFFKAIVLVQGENKVSGVLHVLGPWDLEGTRPGHDGALRSTTHGSTISRCAGSGPRSSSTRPMRPRATCRSPTRCAARGSLRYAALGQLEMGSGGEGAVAVWRCGGGIADGRAAGARRQCCQGVLPHISAQRGQCIAKPIGERAGALKSKPCLAARRR